MEGQKGMRIWREKNVGGGVDVPAGGAGRGGGG